MPIHQLPLISLILATIENQNMVPKAAPYILFMITDSHFTALGAPGDEFMNLNIVSHDGRKLLNKDVYGRAVK